jgi:hypothetical protein
MHLRFLHDVGLRANCNNLFSQILQGSRFGAPTLLRYSDPTSSNLPDLPFRRWRSSACQVLRRFAMMGSGSSLGPRAAATAEFLS